MNIRKERLGKNNLKTLGYFSGYRELYGREYGSLTIHEKITLRTRIFCVPNGDFREFLNWMDIKLG